MADEKPPRELVEGRDYYVEAGRWVFTEAYHRHRGHCCESACRHCPWGFRKPDRPAAGQSGGPPASS